MIEDGVSVGCVVDKTSNNWFADEEVFAGISVSVAVQIVGSFFEVVADSLRNAEKLTLAGDALGVDSACHNSPSFVVVLLD